MMASLAHIGGMAHGHPHGMEPLIVVALVVACVALFAWYYERARRG